MGGGSGKSSGNESAGRDTSKSGKFPVTVEVNDLFGDTLTPKQKAELDAFARKHNYNEYDGMALTKEKKQELVNLAKRMGLTDKEIRQRIDKQAKGGLGKPTEAREITRARKLRTGELGRHELDDHERKTREKHVGERERREKRQREVENKKIEKITGKKNISKKD